MKRALVLLAITACAASTYAQGLINFNTKAGTLTAQPAPATPGAVWAPIFLPQLDGAPASGRWNALPGGTVNYTGGFVSGAGYTAALYGGATADNLSLVATTTFRTQTATTVAGTITPPAAAPSVSGVPAGSQAYLQLRVWNNNGGAVATWDDAVAQGRVRGQSAVFQSAFPLGGGAVTIPNLQGLESFSLVPEPSIFALGALGLGALLLIRRKK